MIIMIDYLIGFLLLVAVWLVCYILYKNRHKDHCIGCRYRENCNKKDAQN